MRRLARAKTLLNLTKANSRATVHRPAYLDYVGGKRSDESGEEIERRFLPPTPCTARPRGRSRCCAGRCRACSIACAAARSHDHKALIEILETYSRDELFQITGEELLEIALGIPSR